MIDYKEVKKKDGTVIVFCRFHDLLTEFYGTENYEGNLVHTGDHDEYIIQCPFCEKEGHTKHKLYITGDLSVGFCFVCNRRFINIKDEVDVSYTIPSFKGFWGYQGVDLVKLNDPVWTLDRYYNEFDDYDERGYNYLISRHGFMKDLYKILGFKFMDGNVVIPFLYHGELIYYQIRFIGNSKIRYFFPPSKKPVYLIDRPGIRKIIVCEGVFDAIACMIMAPEFIPCAVLGSSVSDYQLEFIREYIPDEIIVYMDETDISKRIANKIKSVIDYCPIRIIQSDGEDPEECMKRKLKCGSNLQWIKAKYNNNV